MKKRYLIALIFCLVFLNIPYIYASADPVATPAQKMCDCAGMCVSLVASQPTCEALGNSMGGSCKDTGSCVPGQPISNPTSTTKNPTVSGAASIPPTTLDNPIGATDIPTIIGILIKGAMGVMGALVLLMLVWGGTTWLTSAGKAERVKAGTQTMLWAVIGAVVTVSSYVILNTILSVLSGKI